MWKQRQDKIDQWQGCKGRTEGIKRGRQLWVITGCFTLGGTTTKTVELNVISVKAGRVPEPPQATPAAVQVQEPTPNTNQGAAVCAQQQQSTVAA